MLGLGLALNVKSNRNFGIKNILQNMLAQ